MSLNIPIQNLASILRGKLLQGKNQATLKSIGIDSRQFDPGALFWSLKGERTDGHWYLEAALQAGAAGFIVEKADIPAAIRSRPDLPVILVSDTLKALQDLAAHHRDQKGSLLVAAITGTNGKTTTKQMLASILAQGSPVLATPGNMNSQIGLPLALLELDDSHKACVLEMGASEKGNIERLCRIARPQFGVITNVGRAHLETFGSLENTAQAKWELIRSLPSTGHAILPAQDLFLTPLAKTSPCPVTFVGEGPASTVRATTIHENEGLEFTLELGSRPVFIRLPILGRFNVLNALAAAACAWRMGMDSNSIQKGLASFVPAPMRMTLIHHPSGAVLVNDAYNANPDSMMASLDSFCRHFNNRRRLVVLGSMLELGKESRPCHQRVGQFIKSLPPLEVHLIGEEARDIEEGARQAGVSQERIRFHPTFDSLKVALFPQLSARVAVLFKASRGIHLENLVQEL